MKNYWLQFGNNDPRNYSGLAPTFVLFFDSNGATVAPPGITEIFVTSGLYRFQYNPTLSIAFLADGGATLSSNVRFVAGNLDPLNKIDEQIGSTVSSFGSTSVDPGDIFGMVKRLQELLEGNATFNKTSGVWDIYSRGSSTLLREKTLTDSTNSSSKA